MTPVAITGRMEGREEIRAWLRGLVALNVELLKLARARGRALPPLYRSGVVYRPEPRASSTTIAANTSEDFAPCVVALTRGWGDCDDLAAWRAAELIERGIPADVDVIETRASRPDARRWHIIVTLPDGSNEDPSRVLKGGESWL